MTTVYVPRRGSTKKDRAYHPDPDCQYVGENHREWDRETAEAWGYTPCKECLGDAKTGGWAARKEVEQ